MALPRRHGDLDSAFVMLSDVLDKFDLITVVLNSSLKFKVILWVLSFEAVERKEQLFVVFVDHKHKHLVLVR